MGREDAPEIREDAAALWARMKWLRLSIGHHWPPGGHVEAQNEWLRLAQSAAFGSETDQSSPRFG